MDFSLTKEQEMLKRFVREFAEKEIAPLADQIEHDDRVPDDLIKKMAKLRLFGIPYDKQYGGAGQGYMELALALEAADVDKAFLAGEYMNHLWNALPQRLRGHISPTSDLLVDVVQRTLRPGDVVMVKGSAGSRMGHIVDVLKSPEKGKS